LAAITTVDPAADVLPIVDISDTSMAASGTTKKITSNQILGAGGTATLASATITGDLTVDTNVLKVDTSNNRVGINTASPTVALEVAGSATITGNLTVDSNTLVVTASTDTVCIGATTTDAKFRILDASGNGVRIGFSPGVLNYNLYDATVHEFRAVGGTNSFGAITANGIGLGVTPAASGIGVAFPATQVASSDANTLDDYEEGTWTPALTFATPGTLAVTYNTQSGSYTKIGRLVTVIFRLSFAAAGIIKGTASGNLSITGLPFTVGSAIAYQYVDLGSSITDITTGSFALITATGTSISFETVSTSGTRIQRDSTGLTAASFAASNAGFVTISGTFTYFV
jgi:hypothetical protein